MIPDDDIINAIQIAFEAHRDDDHTGIPPAESLKMVAEHQGMVKNIDLLVCEIAGKPDPLTGERGPGLASRMKDLEHRANGGGGFSVKQGDKVRIALYTMIGTVIANVGVMFVLILR